ncbi:MAG: DUF2934 domain-containing protein [Bryobacterales bacterium]|jgi:hypothetical protein|nr:DUF2934 domain-containing protein [Bryobacterales bacterium]
MPQQATKATPVPETSTASELQPGQEQIAALAHALWEARGCPEGSPEEDWYRAEEQLKGQIQNTAAHL